MQRADPIIIQIPHYGEVGGTRLPWISRLQEVFREAERVTGIVSNLIVHGSFGDFTTTGFSDLEVSVVLKPHYGDAAAFAMRRWLTGSLNPFILHVDPLQHHGAFFLWDDFREHYNEAVLPVKSYTECWAMRACELELRPDIPDLSDTLYAFDVTVNSLYEYERTFFRYGVTPYALKRLISNALILPAFLYQSLGQMLTKREALNEIQRHSIPSIASTIEAATRLRLTWQAAPDWLGRARAAAVASHIPGGRLDRLIVNAYRSARFGTSAEVTGFLSSIRPYCSATRTLRESL